MSNAAAGTASALVAALLMVGCAGSGTSDKQPTPDPVPSPTESHSSAPSSTPVKGKPPKLPTRAQQARLDRQLRDAAWANDVAGARRLIGRGADVNAKDQTQQSAYLIATSEGYVGLLRLCLDNEARVDEKDSWNGTGLIRAAERGHYRVVGLLLQAGIDRDHVNRIGYQAIHEAVWLGENNRDYADTLRVLVAGGVELDRPSVEEGLTPLQMAENKFFPLSVGVLAAAARPAPQRPDDALLMAAASNDGIAAAIALRAGADPKTEDDRGRTATDLAPAGGEVARLLAALGLDKGLDRQVSGPE